MKQIEFKNCTKCGAIFVQKSNDEYHRKWNEVLNGEFCLPCLNTRVDKLLDAIHKR